MNPSIKLTPSQNLKTKLSTTLKSWLPILQSSGDELEDTLKEFIKDNPYAEIKNHSVQDFSTKSSQSRGVKRSRGEPEGFENFCLYEQGLYEVLGEQICPPLFPTPLSQSIAQEIIEDLNDEGYFEGDIAQIAQRVGCDESEVEKIRKRFAYLEPKGIGARDVIESFGFQLEQSELSAGGYDLASEILKDLHNHFKHKNHPNYNEVMKVIKTFRNPPALEYAPKEQYIKPDIFVFFDEGEIKVSLNMEANPSIQIQKDDQLSHIAQEQFVKTKLKEARLLVDALEMRQATLRKIGLMIVEYQYEFFTGGEIKPMKLKDLADEFGHAPSTISRAIANKYLECDRGTFPIKSFFSAALDDDVSNSSIKDFINDLVKNEDRKKPLSDNKILQLIEAKFGIKIVRRTITKYRQKLNIASSSERKKLYEMSV